jgi:membrane dipeptidase
MYKPLKRREFIRLSATGLVLPTLGTMGAMSYPGFGYNRRDKIELTEKALEIHRSAIVIDGHNDLPMRLRANGHFSLENFNLDETHPEFHTDIPRMRKGGIDAQFWAAYVSPKYIEKGDAAKVGIEQVELIHRMVEKHSDTLELAVSAGDIRRISNQGKIASLIGVEGGRLIDNSLSILRTYQKLGARYLTLTHNDNNDWADSGTDYSLHGGLSDFGKEVVREMNRLGMLVDISHTSMDTIKDALRVSKAPVIASHSAAYSLSNTTRNICDENLEKIAKNGGIIMVPVFPCFLTQEGAKLYIQYIDYMRELKAEGRLEEEIETMLNSWVGEQPSLPGCTVHEMVDHIEHIIKIAGIDHVGIGSDFDGGIWGPEQFQDVSGYPYVTQVLVDRGYSKEDIHKILGGNFLRVFQKAEDLKESWE